MTDGESFWQHLPIFDFVDISEKIASGYYDHDCRKALASSNSPNTVRCFEPSMQLELPLAYHLLERVPRKVDSLSISRGFQLLEDPPSKG